MTERMLELALLLPREAECRDCVQEVGRELLRLDGVTAVTADVPHGLLTVRFDEDLVRPDGIELYARRAGAQAHCALHCPDAVHEHGVLDLQSPAGGDDGLQRRMLHVTGMDCADCADKLQSALRKEAGVAAADVSFGAATLALVFDPEQTNIETLSTVLRRLGYDTLERRAGSIDTPDTAPVASAPGSGAWLHQPRSLLTLVSGALIVAGFVVQAVTPSLGPWLFALAMLTGGTHVARAAFYSARARQVDMNVLMTLAAVGAAAIGEWAEAALVVFLFSLGTMLQAGTLERTRRAIRSLMELAPATARVVREGREIEEAAAGLVADDVVVVRPGERLAVDGIVLEGSAGADQAPVTGESALVGKAPGDQVFAGSIIEGGSLRVLATTGAADNTIARIVHLVEEAQARRAPSQTIVDRFASRYTPIVVALAAAVALVPPLFGEPFGTWFYRGLAVLIISCPCALVISTPVSILAALARATRDGVLIKGGVHLEQAAKIRAIAFDKTGTLTAGKPKVTDVIGLNGTSEGQVLAVAAAVESFSEHPLARAIVAAADAVDDAEKEGCACGSGDPVAGDGRCGAPSRIAAAVCACEGPSPGASCCGAGDEASAECSPSPAGLRVGRFRSLPGRGVRAEVDGRLYFVGRPELLGGAGDDPVLLATVSRLEGEGKTAIVIGDKERPLGVIAVSDPLRPGAPDAVRQLRELGIERITMLTGDNPETAAVIAREAGIDDVRAGLLPADKVAAATDLRERFGRTAMVGDGVNDAPALAASDVGIAMGAAGTDTALETADIVLMGDDIEAIPATIRLARRTTRVIWQNIAVAIAVKALFLVLAPLGLATLWMAVFADMGTSLLVTGNGLRLFRR
jgi:Cd2+/Zn2+-exporting ATPase